MLANFLFLILIFSRLAHKLLHWRSVIQLPIFKILTRAVAIIHLNSWAIDTKICFWKGCYQITLKIIVYQHLNFPLTSASQGIITDYQMTQHVHNYILYVRYLIVYQLKYLTVS